MDEPFAALDYERTISLRRIISDIAKKMELSVLFVSHDLEESIILGDQIVFLSKNPAKVLNILDIKLPYPRIHTLSTSEEFNYLRQISLDIFWREAEGNSL
jgi:NitT/TauT family transport system ATP-binding protein